MLSTVLSHVEHHCRRMKRGNGKTGILTALPRHLFSFCLNLPSRSNFLFPLQVLDERVYHIEYAPEQPEPYYKATGKELQPRPVGEEHGIIVSPQLAHLKLRLTNLELLSTGLQLHADQRGSLRKSNEVCLCFEVRRIDLFARALVLIINHQTKSLL